MHPILVFLILFYLVAFAYDKVIDREIENNQILTSKLAGFKFFNSLQSRPQALYSVLSFQYFGVSTILNIVGSIFSSMMYLGAVFGIYFIAQ